MTKDTSGEMTRDDLITLNNQLSALAAEGQSACRLAEPALARLVSAMSQRSGQAYTTRAILFSLWNGKPTSLMEIVCLDWEVRKDLAAVFLAFGFADGKVEFFYNAVAAAIHAGGQWKWFLEEETD